MHKGWLVLLLSILSFGFFGFFARISQMKGASSFLLTILTAIGGAMIALFVCLPQIDLSSVKNVKSCIIPGVAAGLCVGLGNIFLYKSLQTIPASIAFPANGLWILVTVFLCLVFLKEQISLVQGCGIGCAFLAVFLLSR
jgi:uncharacterized membrane protein